MYVCMYVYCPTLSMAASTCLDFWMLLAVSSLIGPAGMFVLSSAEDPAEAASYIHTYIHQITGDILHAIYTDT